MDVAAISADAVLLLQLLLFCRRFFTHTSSVNFVVELIKWQTCSEKGSGGVVKAQKQGETLLGNMYFFLALFI